MTALETVNLIRMLIDEARESFVDIDFINNVVNDAILMKTRLYYGINDERALRPLYRIGYNASSENMVDGDIIRDSTGSIAKVMYPRSCRIFTPASRTEGTDINNRAQTMVAGYIDNPRYFNYIINKNTTQTGFNQAFATDGMPRAGYYTIKKGISSTLHFVYNIGNEQANIWYLKQPETFLYKDNDIANSINIELPDEYHPEITMLASELINDIDVEELERGNIVYQNQRINIENSGL